jgi:hypothetical protein
VLLLVDISGYTAFLQAVGAAHGEQMAAMPEVPAAYPLMTSLLTTIVDRVAPPFTLSKLEGDAVFAYAPDDTFTPRGEQVLECVRDCAAAFRELRDRTETLMLCSCDACSRLGTLEVKFVLHHGHYVVQRITGHEELLGPDVTLAHLLLKNRVTDLIGRVSYALVTSAAARHLALPLEGSVPHHEQYDHAHPVDAHVFRLSTTG